jgi:hypothetical protein
MSPPFHGMAVLCFSYNLECATVAYTIVNFHKINTEPLLSKQCFRFILPESGPGSRTSTLITINLKNGNLGISSLVSMKDFQPLQEAKNIAVRNNERPAFCGSWIRIQSGLMVTPAIFKKKSYLSSLVMVQLPS